MAGEGQHGGRRRGVRTASLGSWQQLLLHSLQGVTGGVGGYVIGTGSSFNKKKGSVWGPWLVHLGTVHGRILVGSMADYLKGFKAQKSIHQGMINKINKNPIISNAKELNHLQ